MPRAWQLSWPGFSSRRRSRTASILCCGHTRPRSRGFGLPVLFSPLHFRDTCSFSGLSEHDPSDSIEQNVSAQSGGLTRETSIARGGLSYS